MNAITLLSIKDTVILLILHIVVISCASTDENSGQTYHATYSRPDTINPDSLPELTPKQQSSFDALNMLQESADDNNHLYSTYAGVAHPCYPPDTSITISRSVLLNAMQQFVAARCTALTIEKRNELLSAAVLAQEDYLVLHCLNDVNEVNYENGLPMIGTWVICSVLGRRDIVLVW